MYLIGRSGQRPRWVGNESLVRTFYRRDPWSYEPRRNGSGQGSHADNDAAQSAQGLEGLCPWERLELASLTP